MIAVTCNTIRGLYTQTTPFSLKKYDESINNTIKRANETLLVAKKRGK